VKSLFIKLKNANSYDFDVAINNLHPKFLFLFSKILKIELNKGHQSLFSHRDSINTHKLRFLITFFNQNGMIQTFPHTYKFRKPISNF